MATGNENLDTAVTPALLDQLRDGRTVDVLRKRDVEAATADFTARLPAATPGFFAAAAVEGATPANLLAWATARGKLRAGAADSARIAFVGDSKTMGAGAGTGAKATDGAFARSRPARLAALLVADSLPTRLGFAGFNGTLSPADRAAYDPRLTFGAGWSGSTNSLGGGMFAGGAGSGELRFQPTSPADRFSLLYRGGADRPTFSIAKGAETINVVPSGATMSYVRHEAVFAAKDAQPIIITRTGGSNALTIVGGVAWDSSTPAVEVMNFGVYGVVSAFWTDASTALTPLSALGAYAPHLTVVNLGTNDLAQNVPMATWLANLRAIIGVAKSSGSVVLTWPAIAGVGVGYGSDPVRAPWMAALRSLAAEMGCLFVNEEALLGGRAAAQAAGALPDGVHEAGWAYDVQASAIARAII